MRKEMVAYLREKYPVGLRVELTHIEDIYTRLTEGAKGTVMGVDDMGTIHVKWDCGSTLGLIYGVDSCRAI